MKKIVFCIFLFFFFFVAFGVSADTIGEKRLFYIDPSYDFAKREEVSAILVKKTEELYFYIDENWWNSAPQNEIYQKLSELGEEFHKTIYPKLTSVFGSEWKPGIDNDPVITVLFHPLREGAAGYFSSKDEYPRVLASNSNKREMVYLNSDYITSPLLKSFLAHEFVHLITFNQKEAIRNIKEDVWLNEARADYASTYLGYDDSFEGSNLQKRLEIFLNNPSDSLTDWRGEEADYGVINLFIQYLVDHYGVEILADSLHSSKAGIESINYALEKNGFKERFSDIFVDWTIAVFINDCNFGEKYCYLNKNLRNFSLSPQINFLPLSGKSSLSLTESIKNWTAKWYKIIGGRGTLEFVFSEEDDASFKVPYIIKDKNGSYHINFLDIDGKKEAKISIDNFGIENTALIFIPSLGISSENKTDRFFSFSWTSSIVKTQQEIDRIQQLLDKIAYLQAEIARIKAQISAILASRIGKNNPDCQIRNNLYYGLRNNQEVRCLQQFLKEQGPEIYPEGLITGNFFSLTLKAVIRFQEKYASEILHPLGLTRGTGYVGKRTRAKINELIARY